MKTEDLSRFVDRLNHAMPGLECPMCHGHEFTVVDGLFPNAIQQSLNSIQIGGPSIPCVAFICNHCGFLSQHAIGILDPQFLRPQKEEGKKE